MGEMTQKSNRKVGRRSHPVREAIAFRTGMSKVRSVGTEGMRG